MKLAWFLSEADIRDSREKSLSVKKKKKNRSEFKLFYLQMHK